MSKSNTPKLNSEEDKIKQSVDEGIDQADAMYKQAKDKANELYEEGKQAVCDAQDYFKESTDNLIRHVKENPLTSLLIAGGVGFILSSLLKK
ncbi:MULTISPECIES: DUF883 family protein [Legionella]|uniref:DUF883 domain-containing protein n=1 Tax=Legionella drozanskii LLAP-1 TaxID=1212489 RepID=A0A0W0T0U9_9GAMM|nr:MULTISPECIES: hypothetical protein [Legionella]KTC89246.1 hypothetical protein Ldro_0735 [Legionella drozanskii LLAP-1]PJE13396.1 MAG: hypothetical protein CK430_06470 [Legionella sp.]